MKSDELCPGSKEWHHAMAEELKEDAKKEKDKEQKIHLLEISEFHKLIGDNQPSARSAKNEKNKDKKQK